MGCFVLVALGCEPSTWHMLAKALQLTYILSPCGCFLLVFVFLRQGPQDGLQYAILLLQPPEYWGYRCVSLLQDIFFLLKCLGFVY